MLDSGDVQAERGGAGVFGDVGAIRRDDDEEEVLPFLLPPCPDKVGVDSCKLERVGRGSDETLPYDLGGGGSGRRGSTCVGSSRLSALGAGLGGVHARKECCASFDSPESAGTVGVRCCRPLNFV